MAKYFEIGVTKGDINSFVNKSAIFLRIFSSHSHSHTPYVFPHNKNVLL